MTEIPIFNEATISAVRGLDERARLEILCVISGESIAVFDENILPDDPTDYEIAFWACYQNLVSLFFSERLGFESDSEAHAAKLVADAEALRDELDEELKHPGTSSDQHVRRFGSNLGLYLRAFGGHNEDEDESVIFAGCAAYCSVVKSEWGPDGW